MVVFFHVHPCTSMSAYTRRMPALLCLFFLILAMCVSTYVPRRTSDATRNIDEGPFSKASQARSLYNGENGEEGGTLVCTHSHTYEAVVRVVDQLITTLI